MIENPVAGRVLNCQFEGRREEVIVRLGPPSREDDHFICEYEIYFAGRTGAHKIIGLDGIHALQLAIFMVGSALKSIQGASDWSWNGEPYTGFPSSLDEPIVGLRS